MGTLGGMLWLFRRRESTSNCGKPVRRIKIKPRILWLKGHWKVAIKNVSFLKNVKSLWDLALQKFKESVKDIPGKWKGCQTKEGNKKNTVCIWEWLIWFFMSKAWKVVEGTFIHSTINYWTPTMCSTCWGTVLDKIDKNPWHHFMKWHTMQGTTQDKNTYYGKNI